MDPLFFLFTRTSCCCVLLLSLVAFSLQLFLLSQIVFAVNNNGSLSECPDHEKVALLQVKHGFVINRGHYKASSRLDSWNPDIDCCSWEGITCDKAMGNVIGLDLGSNWHLDRKSSVIEGRLDSSLFHLCSLQKLNLSWNYFYPNPIPSGLGQLNNLTHLDLSHSNFLGQIPLEISRLTNLISLSLSQDYSVGGLELINPSLTTLIQNLSNLRQLSLDYIQISEHGGKWAQALSIALPNLRHLCLRHCGLEGPIDPSLFQLPALSQISLDGNNFSIAVPNFLGNFSPLTSLSLRGSNLFGSLPSFIGNFSQLEILDLSSNYFSGMIPFSYANELQHLTALILDNNSLEGSVPLSLFTHPSLQLLSLTYNQLDGCLLDFPNKSSSALERIYLDNNKLHGSIPRSIFELPKLTHLALSYNNFTGTIGLHMFQNIKTLSYLCLAYNNLSFINSNDSSHLISSSQIYFLHLSSCNISEFPDILQSLNHLLYLILSRNKIHGEIPNWIWKVGNWSLRLLDLSNNFLESFEHTLPKFPQLSNLATVDLHSNRLRGSLPVFPPHVSFLDYSNNNFSSVIPATIIFTFIRFFFLSNNNVSGEIPLSVCDARVLQMLDLSNNKFSGYLPTCIGKIGTYLEILNLHGNAFQGNVPEMFNKNCMLKTLNLNSNQLEGLIPQSLANCKTLEVLDLGHNRLNDTFPFWLEKLSNLRILILRSNTFHGPIARSHTTSPLFPFLQIFDISSNFFVGIVPSTFFLNWTLMTGEDGSNFNSNNQIVRHQISGFYYQDSVTITMKDLDVVMEKILTALTSVDLSNNRFRGEIPKSVCNLKLLHVLNFSHNDFIGPIPTSLENLAQLESLDLSRNRLSGNIPRQLTRLTFLAVLNLSQNLLSGSIPQSQQFLTFTNNSFLENAGLCGPPLTKKCEDTIAPPPSTFDGFCLDEDREIDWEFMWIGSGVGFGAFFWTLALWRKGSRKYMQFIDKMFICNFSNDCINCTPR